MSGLAVFGYASLVSRASIAETLGRDAPPPVPARLAGWRRRWSLARVNKRCEKEFEAVNGRPFVHCLGLNIERAPGATPGEWPNGGLVALSEAELERLDLREVRYDRVDVTADVRVGDTASRFDRIVAFTAKPQNLAPSPPPDSVVIASYLHACDAAFGELGAGELAAFRATTGEPPAPVIEARLVRDTIPAGNPRAW